MGGGVTLVFDNCPLSIGWKPSEVTDSKSHLRVPLVKQQQALVGFHFWVMAHDLQRSSALCGSQSSVRATAPKPAPRLWSLLEVSCMRTP